MKCTAVNFFIFLSIIDVAFPEFFVDKLLKTHEMKDPMATAFEQ
jgi:hypothetical protein